MRLTEKYRPQSIQDLVGQKDVVETINPLLQRPERLPNLLLVGDVGVGKTSLALIIQDMLSSGHLEYNASEERATTFLQSVKQASKFKTNLVGGKMVILLEEAESLRPRIQQGLRRIMENPNAVFILTCNDSSGIADAIKDRCLTLKFRDIPREAIVERLKHICNAEDFSNSDEILEKIADNSDGSMRKAITLLEAIVE